MREVQRLFFDLETAPGIGHFYDIKKEYAVFHVIRAPYLNSVAWAWNDGPIQVKALPDFPGYKKNLHDDSKLANFIHDELLEKANLLIAHNGDQFDIKFLNARMIFHRLDPIPPKKSADTLKMHRATANVPSHRLDYLAQYYGIGQKLAHHGKDMWLGCERGDMKEWDTMKKYNKHDVHLLRELHKLILPWAKTYPNLNLIHGKPSACPRCQSTHINKKGADYSYTLKASFQMYRCLDCRATMRGERLALDFPVQFS